MGSYTSSSNMWFCTYRSTILSNEEEMGALGWGAGAISAVDATDGVDINPAAPNQKRTDAQNNLIDLFNLRVDLRGLSGLLLSLVLWRRKSGDSSFSGVTLSTEGYPPVVFKFLIWADGEGAVKPEAPTISKFKQIVNFIASLMVVFPLAKIFGSLWWWVDWLSLLLFHLEVNANKIGSKRSEQVFCSCLFITSNGYYFEDVQV